MKFTGTHTTGRGRGNTLGFPTINLHDINSLIIEDGVYAARVTIQNVQYNAALFVGGSPTFREKEKSVELFLIGLSPEEIVKNRLDRVITTKISVETVSYIRPVIKFSSKDELIRHIQQDVQQISTILS